MRAEILCLRSQYVVYREMQGRLIEPDDEILHLRVQDDTRGGAQECDNFTWTLYLG